MPTYWISIDSCPNRVPADLYHLVVSRVQVSTHRGQVFFEVIRWQVTSFQVIAGSSSILFKFIWNILCLCAAQLKVWLQTDLRRENAASCYGQGRQLVLTFLTMVMRWSRSTSNFYALIGQNLTGEFMGKIYTASWILFILTAEADRGLCQLVVFLTVFFHWMYEMKFSCYQEPSVIHSQSVYWVFGWKIRRLSKSEIRFRMASFSFLPCLISKRVAKSEAILALLDTFQELHLEWWARVIIIFDVCFLDRI